VREETRRPITGRRRKPADERLDTATSIRLPRELALRVAELAEIEQLPISHVLRKLIGVGLREVENRSIAWGAEL
jgi:predicted DNA-binding protein